MPSMLNPRFEMACRLQASHLSDRKFPSSMLGFSQKNLELYREMLVLLEGCYYV